MTQSCDGVFACLCFCSAKEFCFPVLVSPVLVSQIAAYFTQQLAVYRNPEEPMIQFPVFTFKLLTVRSHLSTRCSYHYCVHTSQHKVAQPMLPYHSLSKTQPPPPNATITTKCHHTHFHSLPAHHTHLYLPLPKLVRLFIYLNSTHTHTLPHRFIS